MSTVSTTNARATKATGTRAKKKSGNTPASSDGVVREPSAKTLASIADIEAGNFETAYSIEELKAALLGKTKS